MKIHQPQKRQKPHYSDKKQFEGKSKSIIYEN